MAKMHEQGPPSDPTRGPTEGLGHDGAHDDNSITRRVTIGTLAGLMATPIAASALRGPRMDGNARSLAGPSAQASTLGRGPANMPGTATSDATGVGFRRLGRGAVMRTVQEELTDLASSPEQYGAAGDGVTDDTAAMQAAFDAGRSVRLTQGRRYLIRSRLTLASDGVSLTGGGTIRIAADFQIAADIDSNGTHMRALFVTGSDVVIDGVTFDATEAPIGSAVENGFIWTTGPYTSVRDCLFIGNRVGTCIWALGNAPYLGVTGCRFRNCSGAVFAKGRNSLINDNIIVNATDAAIALNGRSCVGAVVANNTISNETGATIPAMIAVEECASNWAITGNVLIGVNGGGIVCINVLDHAPARGGIIANNIIEGAMFDGTVMNTKNPGAMLSVSPLYLDWVMRGNTVSSPPRGNSNSRMVSIAASGGVFEDNVVDGSRGSDLSALIEILPGATGLTIKDNKTSCFAGGRHYIFSPGSYNKSPCRFVGGIFIGGEQGVNSDFHKTAIKDLVLQICNIQDNSAKALFSAEAAIGDRARFFNAGAWRYPHKIGVTTEMYCDAVPSSPGNIPFATGDRFHFMAPKPDQPLTIVRMGAGWRSSG